MYFFVVWFCQWTCGIQDNKGCQEHSWCNETEDAQVRCNYLFGQWVLWYCWRWDKRGCSESYWFVLWWTYTKEYSQVGACTWWGYCKRFICMSEHQEQTCEENWWGISVWWCLQWWCDIWIFLWTEIGWICIGIGKQKDCRISEGCWNSKGGKDISHAEEQYRSCKCY